MAVDPVPWFIQAPAEHSAEVARTLAYQAIGGKEGLARAGDLIVRALPVPGGAVQVLPGAAGILNRGSGGGGQAYVGRVGAAVTVPIAATGSGGGRSDLIVFRVDDPQYGGQTPDSPVEGPYIRLDVVSGVNVSVTRVQDVPGHEADSAVTLARVDLPASTGTVTDAMVTPLATVASPRREESVFARPRIAADDTPERNLTASVGTGGEFFPGGGGVANEFQVVIPEWAAYAVIDASWLSIYYGANRNPFGDYWLEFGDEYRPHTWPNKQQFEFATQHFSFNAPLTADEKTTNWLLMDTVPIAEKLRGKRATFAFKAGYGNSPGAGSVWMNSQGGLGCRITFVEQLIAANLA
ncbi:hypothetical protein ACFSWE_09585 [Leucobacter albus]|uniref:Uncharacterized protein n=1 Tax=Leucobacter albus TaxID=272210 RepID=A0ABW3TQL9_9MICO